MRSERNWSGDAYKRARQEGQQVELLMRSILKLFAEGNLVYRNRTQRSAPVQTKSERLKRIRRGLITTPLEPGLDNTAVA